ncbi:hypothetical protein DEU56DRAFT_742502, partial [Suillus clintonianus]|uniref:uncharacterized protein n=1 Tax=Suillus clintonianus TaxID=1904413 RepID=UPI001B88704D
MENTVKEVRSNIQESVEELVRAAKGASQVTSNQPHVCIDNTGSNGPQTYAAAVKTNPPMILTKALAKSEAHARQILIDRRSPFYSNTLKDLTEAQLVAKATLAIELISKDDNNIPKDLVFLSARRLPHGGVLYELNSAVSAKWFDDPAHRSKFLEHFGIEVVIKDRSFHVIVENAPISFIPD